MKIISFVATHELSRAIAASALHARTLAQAAGISGPMLSRIRGGAQFGFTMSRRVILLARHLGLPDDQAVREVIS